MITNEDRKDRISVQAGDGDVKRPWSKPTVSLMHRLVRVNTEPVTNQANIPELPNYTQIS